MVNRIAAAIAEEIGIAAAETERIALEEASQSRIVEAIAVIVDAQFGKIFPPREHEPVSIPTVGSRTRAAPGGHGRFAESIVTIFLYTVTVGIKQKGDVAHPIQVIAQIPMNGVVPIEDFVRAGPIYIPRYTAPYVVLQDRFPSIIHDDRCVSVDCPLQGSPQSVIGEFSAVFATGRRCQVISRIVIRAEYPEPGKIEISVVGATCATHRIILSERIGRVVCGKSVIGHA